MRNGEREALHEAGVVVGAEAIIRAAASEEAVRAALNLIAQVPRSDPIPPIRSDPKTV